MEYLLIVIIILLLIIKIFDNFKLKKKLNFFYNEKCELINNNIELKEKLEELEEEINIFSMKRKEFTKLNNNSEFTIRVAEELERKKRYEKSIFSILTINIDFFEEYEKLYKNIEEIKRKLVKKIAKRIRKIDFLGEGDKKGRLQLLLPLTNLDGSLILAKRLQEEVKRMDNELMITISIIITEIRKEKDIDIDKIFLNIENKSKESLSNGGNTIVIEKN
ncbi:MAG: hypothetical protein B6I28_05425 [Fusobacteriia bacterium 4572_132]|nr:MAG: hypothetical protein B6I28_05425 [Fusobacteriia bacterium 4572_132]